MKKNDRPSLGLSLARLSIDRSFFAFTAFSFVCAFSRATTLAPSAEIAPTPSRLSLVHEDFKRPPFGGSSFSPSCPEWWQPQSRPPSPLVYAFCLRVPSLPRWIHHPSPFCSVFRPCGYMRRACWASHPTRPLNIWFGNQMLSC